MTPDDKPKFAMTITALLETLPGREPSAATIRGYWMGLEDLPLEAFQTAAERAIRSCRFMPSPAEIRELAGEACGDDRALLAWAAVLKAVPLGAYKHLDFDDGLINAAIRMMGGWPALLERGSEDFDKWARKEFLKTYVGLMRAGVDGEACRPLVGLSDRGVQTVRGRKIELNPVVRVETGLPPLATTPVIAAPGRPADVPRMELKTP